ncbi:MAG: pyridoxal-phosphate dependent enzyme, partial [Myxococcota bacterium]|nr:pyridoxal-phosphate dependent enzyme [Myxococcota bacterium]
MVDLQPIGLARLPTPIQYLERTSARLGVDVWIKRDDLTGLGLSGNKVRKLEWLLADALRRGATTLVTTGGIQSNHCRATAACAARLGLR